MLAKWSKNRPTRFYDYPTMPSRFDLSHLLVGMYNMAWNYQQVADAVGMVYGTADQHLRGEMVTSSLIAHRRKRMLGNMENWDTDKVVQRRLSFVPEYTKPSLHSAYVYDWDENKAIPVHYTNGKLVA